MPSLNKLETIRELCEYYKRRYNLKPNDSDKLLVETILKVISDEG